MKHIISRKIEIVHTVELTQEDLANMEFALWYVKTFNKEAYKNLHLEEMHKLTIELFERNV